MLCVAVSLKMYNLLIFILQANKFNIAGVMKNPQPTVYYCLLKNIAYNLLYNFLTTSMFYNLYNQEFFKIAVLLLDKTKEFTLLLFEVQRSLFDTTFKKTATIVLLKYQKIAVVLFFEE